jgi:chromosome segregation ATPase
MPAKHNGNGATSTHTDPEAVIAAAERRLSDLRDDLALKAWRQRELADSGAPKAEIAAAERSVAELTAEIESRQSFIADLRMRLGREKLDRLEAESNDLQSSTSAAYEAFKSALADADRHEVDSERKRIELLNHRNATKGTWDNLALKRGRCKDSNESVTLGQQATAAGEAFKHALEALEKHEIAVGAKRRSLALRIIDAEGTWNGFRSKRLDASRRLEEFRSDPSVIAVLRVKSAT